MLIMEVLKSLSSVSDVHRVVSYIICQVAHPLDVSNVHKHMGWALDWFRHCCYEDLCGVDPTAQPFLEASYVRHVEVSGLVWIE